VSSWIALASATAARAATAGEVNCSTALGETPRRRRRKGQNREQREENPSNGDLAHEKPPLSFGDRAKANTVDTRKQEPCLRLCGIRASEEPQTGFFASYRHALAGTSPAATGTTGELHALRGAAEGDARRRDGRERHDRQC